MNEMYSAYITEVKEDLKGGLIKSLEFVGWKRQVKKDPIVFVKPNFTFPYYKEGITTTSGLLRNLLEVRNIRRGQIEDSVD